MGRSSFTAYTDRGNSVLGQGPCQIHRPSMIVNVVTTFDPSVSAQCIQCVRFPPVMWTGLNRCTALPCTAVMYAEKHGTGQGARSEVHK